MVDENIYCSFTAWQAENGKFCLKLRHFKLLVLSLLIYLLVKNTIFFTKKPQVLAHVKTTLYLV
jgi:hypothetical protein